MARKKSKSIILRIILLVFSVYMIYQLSSLEINLISLRRENKAASEKKEKISLEVEELNHLLEKGSEKDIIEKAARDRLGYVFSDEQVFVDISGN